MRAEVIRWRDSATISNGRWIEDDGFVEDFVIVTVGLVVREDKTWVYLAQSVDDSGSICGGFQIPKGCIIERLQLRKMRT